MTEVIEIRDVSRSDARAELLKYYEEHSGEHYPSDVALELRIDALLAHEVVLELVAEGELVR